MPKLTKFYPTFILAASLLPLVASAQDIDTTISRLRATFTNVIGLLFLVATAVFIWGLVTYIAAGTDESKQKGRSLMLWGIIALAVMSAAWGFVQILLNYFGVSHLPPPPGP